MLSSKNKIFQAVITRLLRKNPKNRYKNADELVLALEVVLCRSDKSPLPKEEKISKPDKAATSVGLVKQLTPDDVTSIILPPQNNKKTTLIAGLIFALLVSGYFIYTNHFQSDEPTTVNSTILQKSIITQEIKPVQIQPKNDNSEHIQLEVVETPLRQQHNNEAPALEASNQEVIVSKDSIVPVAVEILEETNQQINSPSLGQQQEIKQLLQQAQIDIDNWRLLRPASNNAYGKFIQILNSDGQNIQAKKGLLEIISKYVSLSEQKSREKKFTQSLNMIKTAIKLREEYLNMGYEANDLLGAPTKIVLGKLKIKQKQIQQQAKSYQQRVVTKNSSQPDNLALDFKKGLDFYNAKSYQEAFVWLSIAANKQHPAAQFLLGDLYYSGKGTSQNDNKALELYQKAANQNYLNAQMALATMYQQGSGVMQDETTAIRWLERAAAQANPKPQYQLGIIAYKKGKKQSQNYKITFDWFAKAAQLNDPRAQNKLGMMYKLGRGTPESFDKALEWFNKAAQQNLAEAQDNLGLMYFKGLGVKRDFEKSVEWYRKAADQNFADSQGILGAMYEYGRGVRKNSATAVMWYKLAAKQGNKFAIKKLKKRGISKY